MIAYFLTELYEKGLDKVDRVTWLKEEERRGARRMIRDMERRLANKISSLTFDVFIMAIEYRTVPLHLSQPPTQLAGRRVVIGGELFCPPR